MSNEIAGPPEMLTPQAAAERLGTTVRFVRRLIAERRIAFFKVGRHVRISPTDLAAYLAAGRVDPPRVSSEQRQGFSMTSRRLLAADHEGNNGDQGAICTQVAQGRSE